MTLRIAPPFDPGGYVDTHMYIPMTIHRDVHRQPERELEELPGLEKSARRVRWIQTLEIRNVIETAVRADYQVNADR
jgi:hypothetical protein